MHTPTTAAPARRTQGERSAATQARLLDAAVACLVELGYAATTTTVVAERAGVSRGAQLHHYATRAELMGAAVQHVFRGLTEDYQRGFAGIAKSRDRVRGAVDLLWEMFRQPRHLAALDLYLAARTDPELRAALAPVSAQHRDNVLRLAREYFPAAAAQGPAFAATLDLVLDAMLGMAVGRVLYGERPAETAVLEEIHALASRTLDGGGGDAPGRDDGGGGDAPGQVVAPGPRSAGRAAAHRNKKG